MSEEKKVEDSSKAPEKNKHHDRYKVSYPHKFNLNTKIFFNLNLEPLMG